MHLGSRRALAVVALALMISVAGCSAMSTGSPSSDITVETGGDDEVQAASGNITYPGDGEGNVSNDSIVYTPSGDDIGETDDNESEQVVVEDVEDDAVETDDNESEHVIVDEDAGDEVVETDDNESKRVVVEDVEDDAVETDDADTDQHELPTNGDVSEFVIHIDEVVIDTTDKSHETTADPPTDSNDTPKKTEKQTDGEPDDTPEKTEKRTDSDPGELVIVIEKDGDRYVVTIECDRCSEINHSGVENATAETVDDGTIEIVLSWDDTEHCGCN